MKNRFTLVLIALLLTGCLTRGQNPVTLTEADYDRAVAMLGGNTEKLVDHDIDPAWLPDGRLWYRSQDESGAVYKIFDPASGKAVTQESREGLSGRTSTMQEYIRGMRNEVTSPDGKYMVFLRDWNLWIRETATGTERALTTDGTVDFGYATDNAGWRHSDRPIVSWSPDSKKIATYQQDQRHLNDMYLVETKVGAPVLEAWKYPLPEDPEIIMIHRVIIEIGETPEITRLKMDPDPRRSTLLDDISWRGTFADVAWSEDGRKLLFVSTSRDHKQENVRLADCETGEVEEVFEERVETQYESGQDAICWRYLSGSDEIIWYSERSDWGHLYLYDAVTGELKNQITSGDWVVREVLHVDQKNRVVYFVAGGKEASINPYYRYLYRVDLSGKNLKLLTPEEGDHSVEFSPDGNYFTDSYSQPHVPPVHLVRDSNGKLVATLEKTDISRLLETGWRPPEPFTVRSADDQWDLYGLLFSPTKLNESAKYPVIVHIYPGPQGGSVSSWNFQAARGDCQALAELGFVVVQLEGSCNPCRSKSFHDACYGNMAENTLSDQVSGLKQLAEQYQFMDLARVGIWGHSGGGFATGAAMFKYPDFFKVGISESGNHDNRNYEDDWGERYIGLERYDRNGTSNYEQQANQVFASNLQGKLLLIHGGMDDNVPPYNSYLVADALIKANKDFDFILLPNARHGYRADSYYIMRRRWDYFVQHLLKALPPKEYLIEIEQDLRINTGE